nr:MAG TPA: hypothetical protein [Caudoviricetes sp.]
MHEGLYRQFTLSGRIQTSRAASNPLRPPHQPGMRNRCGFHAPGDR